MPAYQLTSAWQKVASAGQTVEVENLSNAAAIIMTSTGGPPATSDGLVLFGSNPSEQFLLTQDLYARADAGNVTLEVTGGFSLGGSGGAANQYPGSDYAKDGTDVTGASMPAGGAGIRGWLSGIWQAVTGTLKVSTAPVVTATVITPGTPVPPGRKALIACSAAGNLRVKLSGGSTIDLALQVGQSEMDGYAVIDVVAASTTATATVTVLS